MSDNNLDAERERRRAAAQHPVMLSVARAELERLAKALQVAQQRIDDPEALDTIEQLIRAQIVRRLRTFAAPYVPAALFDDLRETFTDEACSVPGVEQADADYFMELDHVLTQLRRRVLADIAGNDDRK